MKDWLRPIVVGVAVSILLSAIRAGWGPKMAMFAWDFFVSSWTVLVGGIAGLLYWNIQFFRNFKKNKEVEFQAWLKDQANIIQDKFASQFSELAKETRELNTTTRASLETGERRINELYRTYEAKITQLEGGKQP